MGIRELFGALLALLCLGLGLLLVEQPRTGLSIMPMQVGTTPATVMQVPGVEAPVVVIAHGFAGSRQLMHPVQLTLARAGYITISYDLEGHGRNPQPMRGDVDDIEGTTRFLVDELARVAQAGLALPGADGRLAVVGHSMASDIVVRYAVEAEADAAVAISMFSAAVSAEAPRNLLILNGQFEGRLRAEAQRIMAEQGVAEGERVGDPASGFARRAVSVDLAEHVGVLYARQTLRETRSWLNDSFEYGAENGVAWIGPPLLLTLIGLVLIAQPISQGLRARRRRVNSVPPGAFWVLALLPAVLTPLVLRLVPTDFLSVLVADYLALHLLVYGVLVLGGLAVEGDAPAFHGWRAGLAVAAFGILVVGAVLDRYVANFILAEGRWLVFAALLPGSILAMTADATLSQAGQAHALRRVAARLGFILSLAIAVALDPGRLFFLVLVMPVLVLFYFSFGLIGGWVGRRTGSAVAMGLGLGVILAWALAATFPLFDGG
ncbi:MAG: alpha/beta fold hydrolase [Pseudomonadota bacterium]